MCRRCHGDGDRSKGRRSDDHHRAGRGTTRTAAGELRDGDGGVRLLCDALRPEHKDLITVQLTSDRACWRQPVPPSMLSKQASGTLTTDQLELLMHLVKINVQQVDDVINVHPSVIIAA